MAKNGPVSTDRRMAELDRKVAQLDQKIAELDHKTEAVREATRAAHAALNDLHRMKRDIDGLIKTGFEERVAAHVSATNRAMAAEVAEFKERMTRHLRKCQDGLTKRWQDIELMCAANDTVAHLIAVDVIDRAGGTVRTSDGSGSFHLVREMESEGGSTFLFPSNVGDRTAMDEALLEALQSALDQYYSKSGKPFILDGFMKGDNT